MTWVAIQRTPKKTSAKAAAASSRFRTAGLEEVACVGGGLIEQRLALFELVLQLQIERGVAIIRLAGDALPVLLALLEALAQKRPRVLVRAAIATVLKACSASALRSPRVSSSARNSPMARDSRVALLSSARIGLSSLLSSCCQSKGCSCSETKGLRSISKCETIELAAIFGQFRPQFPQAFCEILAGHMILGHSPAAAGRSATCCSLLANAWCKAFSDCRAEGSSGSPCLASSPASARHRDRQ